MRWFQVKSLLLTNGVLLWVWVRWSLPYLGLHCRKRDQRELGKKNRFCELAAVCSGRTGGNTQDRREGINVRKLILPFHQAAQCGAVYPCCPEGRRLTWRRTPVLSAGTYLLRIKVDAGVWVLTDASVCFLTRLLYKIRYISASVCGDHLIQTVFFQISLFGL